MAGWSALLDLGLGRRCLSCGAPGESWCDACVREAFDPRVVRTSGGHEVHASSEYADSVRAALLAFKEGGQLSLRRPLGRLLAAAVGSAIDGRRSEAAVVTAPSRRAAMRARGHHHMHGLAKQLPRWHPVPAPVVSVLRWRQAVADQGGLGAVQRVGNVRGAMSARPPSRAGFPVVLVDDIVTTGATLDEAHRALEAVGWRVVGAAVVASVSTRWGVAGDTGLG